MEVWKDIKHFEGLYQVSNLGNVKRLSRIINYCTGRSEVLKERLLKPALRSNDNRRRYYFFVASKNGKRYNLPVHREVAKSFIPNPDNKPEVNHIDGNKLNNHVENLEWVTGEENIRHALKHGLHKRGKNHYKSRPVLMINKKGKIVKEFDCMMDVKKFGFSQGNVGMCCKGKRNVHKNYYWKYKNENK